MNSTTRRHPRSLAEAFPDERAGCIEHYPARGISRLDRIAGVALAVCIGLSLAALAVAELAR